MAALSSVMSCCSNLHTSLPISTTCCLPPRLSSHSRVFPSLTLASSLRRVARVSFTPPLNASSGSRRGELVVSKATEESFDASKVMKDALKDLQEAWAKTEDKVALGSLGFSTFLTLWASTGVISAIDKLPLLPSFFELVGVFYSTWFAYRYLLFKPDREELLKKVKEIFNEITDSDDTD